MATPRPSPSKLMEDSNTAVSPPQPLGNQQALEMEDVIEFVEPLPNELQCPLCLEFLKEPTLTSCCGHHFCRECINRAITRSHVCPLCNNQAFQTLLNKEKQRLVNTLKVYCRRKSQGCEWVGELGRLEHHLDVEEGDCGCVEVECEFGPVGCVAKLPRKDLQRHKEENVHKHLVLMSVMSLKSSEAFFKELREQRMELEGQLKQQRVEFQQQLKQKDEELQAMRESLQQQVEVTQDLRGQLQQNMESKQQTITNLERQLKGEAEQLARVEVELTENAQQFVKVERKLQDNNQQLTMYETRNEKRLSDVQRKWLEEKKEVSRQVSEIDEKIEEAKLQFLQGRNQSVVETGDLRKRIEKMETSLGEEQDQVNENLEANEKRLDDVERRQLEEKQEVVRRVAEVDKKIEEAKIQFQEGCNQTVVEMADLRKRIEQMETSLGEEQTQVNEKIETNEKRLDVFKRKQEEEKVEINRRLAEVDKKVEEKGQELQEVRTQFQQDNNQMDEEITGLRRRIEKVETSLVEGQGQLKEENEKAQMTGLRRRIQQVETSLAEGQGQLKEGNDVEWKQQEEKLEIDRQLADVEKNAEEKGEEVQEVWTQFQQDNDQMNEGMTGLRKRTEQVETSLAEGQDQLKEGNGKAQKLVENLATFVPPPDFTMTYFEKLKKDDNNWYSNPFYSHIGGYKMCLRVSPNGRGSGEGTHVSIFVNLMRGEHDDHLKWPFHGDIAVQLLNRRREEEHVAANIHFSDRRSDRTCGRVIEREVSKRGAGIFEFIAHSALGYNSAKNTEYLRNDCLKFRVTNVKLRNF